MQNTAKQNYPGSVASYNTLPRNEIGLFYNALERNSRSCLTCTVRQDHSKQGLNITNITGTCHTHHRDNGC